MKKRTIYLVLILFSLFIAGCKYDFILPVPVVPVPAGVKFSTQVVPIFSAESCISCHKPGGSKPSPDFTAANAYASIVPSLVNTGSADQSKLLTVPGSSSHNWAKFTANESAIILKWVSEGAKNN